MAESVENRVVEMQFKGSSFVQDIQKAVQAISQLKGSLGGLKGAGSATWRWL